MPLRHDTTYPYLRINQSWVTCAGSSFAKHQPALTRVTSSALLNAMPRNRSELGEVLSLYSQRMSCDGVSMAPFLGMASVRAKAPLYSQRMSRDGVIMMSYLAIASLHSLSWDGVLMTSLSPNAVFPSLSLRGAELRYLISQRTSLVRMSAPLPPSLISFQLHLCLQGMMEDLK
jgi:hypothetical protein